MDRHVTLLGVLYILYHALGLLAGFVVFGTLSGIGLLSGDLAAMGLLAALGTVVGLFLLVVSVPGIIGGIGLLNRQRWARVLVLVVGALNLFNVPIGTALGVYTLWVLLNRDTEMLFLSRPAR